jgi:hypothetical protein
MLATFVIVLDRTDRLHYVVPEWRLFRGRLGFMGDPLSEAIAFIGDGSKWVLLVTQPENLPEPRIDERGTLVCEPSASALMLACKAGRMAPNFEELEDR